MSAFEAEAVKGKNDLRREKKQFFHSEELFRGAREIIIEHFNTQYRLMITKAGKLILNK